MLASLVVSNDLSELSRVGDWVHDCVERYRLPVRTAERLDLCSTEVVTNIVMHGFPQPGGHRIELRLDRRDDHLALEIEDDGAPFDPLEAPPPSHAASLADAVIGGWGIQIVRHFSDGWKYSRAGGRNHLTLLFKVPESSEGPAPAPRDE